MTALDQICDDRCELASLGLWVVLRVLAFGALWRFGALDGGETLAIVLGASAIDAGDTLRRVESRRMRQ